MYKELVKYQLPEFLQNFFHMKYLVIYSYAFLIAFGCLVSVQFTRKMAKKELGIIDLSYTFFYLIFIAGFVGGKLFFYFENPLKYFNNPNLLLDNFSGGFVFYGSFITIIPVVIWYLKKNKIQVLPMLDILAFTTLIVHAFGRFGCYNAGCCYGKSTNSWFGIIFPTSNNTPVHPTQLYEVVILLTIIIILSIVKKYKQFHGQLFLLYISIYGLSRAILENFRGDQRGFIIQNLVSHSQFIALLLLITTILFYYKLNSKKINP